MKYTAELEATLQKRKFTSFWQCLTYLQSAGFNLVDSFGLSLRQFGENRMFSNVAFARKYQQPMYDRHGELNAEYGFRVTQDNLRPQRFPQMATHTRIGNQYDTVPVVEFHGIELGLIDDTNIHLSGLYSVYSTSMAVGGIHYPITEIEKTCEIVQVTGLSKFFIDYVESVGLKHFGYKLHLNK